MPTLLVTQINGHIFLEDVTFLGQPLDFKVGTVIVIPEHGLRIGRATDNDLVLPGSSISRFHFRLVREVILGDLKVDLGIVQHARAPVLLVGKERCIVLRFDQYYIREAGDALRRQRK